MPSHTAFQQPSLLGELGRWGGKINEKSKNKANGYLSHGGGYERRFPARSRGACGSCIVWYTMYYKYSLEKKVRRVTACDGVVKLRKEW